MAVSTPIHRFVRGLLGWYPFHRPTYGMNTFLSWIGFDGKEPRWMAAKPKGELPGIVLNVSNRYHRKNFYFLKVYWRESCEEPLGQFLRATLKPGGVYLDIGAHIGFFSLQASRLVGETGAVHAFEPDPLTVESLTGTMKLNGNNVHIHAVALSDEPGELPLYRAAVQAHSLIPGAGDDARYTGEKFMVPVVRLDDWAAKQPGLDPTKIQALKIDVEGAEAKTAAGGLDLLRRAGLPPIWCEVRGPKGSTRAPNTFADVVAVLGPLGYRPFRWNGGAPAPVEIADVEGREDILFRAEAP